MRLTANELAREAAATGFQTEPLEKVILLLELLEAIRSHPFLKERVVLKGGTALNLFRFDVPRLSVDIDLNYIGAVDREGMLADRPKIEQALQAVCGRVGVQPRRVPSDHAGGKWRLNFNRVAGGTSTLEMDVNFLLRTPLWPAERIDSRAARNVPGDGHSCSRHSRTRGRQACGAPLANGESRSVRRKPVTARWGPRRREAEARVCRLRRHQPQRLANGICRQCHCRRRRGRHDADSAASGK